MLPGTVRCQGGDRVIPKMCNIRNQSRVTTVVSSTSEGYDIGLAKGAGFRTAGSGGAVRVGFVSPKEAISMNEMYDAVFSKKRDKHGESFVRSLKFEIEEVLFIEKE